MLKAQGEGADVDPIVTEAIVADVLVDDATGDTRDDDDDDDDDDADAASMKMRVGALYS